MCWSGGEILSQRYLGHTLLVSVTSDSVTVSLLIPKNRVDARVPARLLDNQWHTIQFLYQLGNLNLVIDRQSVVIGKFYRSLTFIIFFLNMFIKINFTHPRHAANSTYKSLFLTDQEIRNEAAVLILGNMFSGCLLHGPGLVFNTSTMRAQSVTFGPCPLTPGPCQDHDVLIREPVNHCVNEPCMQHGTCFSRADTYECHCTPRYQGRNCEIDKGPPCNSTPCQNSGTCVEDNQGNYRCYCPNGFNGMLCENEVVIHPLCEINPCQNNGTCRVSPATGKVECECAEGYTGARCETDFNDCESVPCQNGGKCTDEVRGFLCDCKGTGYSGTLCQNNVDECAGNNPCLNGGQCFDTYGSYICECSTGYGGPNCEKTISECQSQPCQHGGKCTDHNWYFECSCINGYSGQYCEVTPPCPQCPIDSECLGGRCVCKPGTTGLSLKLSSFLLL